MRRIGLAFWVVVISVGVMAAAQTAGQKLSFHVASVKANAHSGFSPTTRRVAGNRFAVTGMPLLPLIMDAYNLRDWQIVGGPTWINTDQWDIEAVADDGVNLQVFDFENPGRPTPSALMVQSLVENRFQFKFHRETKELPVYELTVAKNGPKLNVSRDKSAVNRRVTRGEIDIEAFPFATFVYLLARQLDRALIDKTNLQGLYDIKLRWSTELKTGAEPSSSSDRPSIFTALHEQLGLRLESSKGPVEVLVIDSVQRATGN
jgi:uncharacterized protein (TIGR03435 family)